MTEEEIDILADLNDLGMEKDGTLRTLLEYARDPSEITPDTWVIAGNDGACAVFRVMELTPGASGGMLVHLELVEDVTPEWLLAERRWVTRSLQEIHDLTESPGE